VFSVAGLGGARDEGIHDRSAAEAATDRARPVPSRSSEDEVVARKTARLARHFDRLRSAAEPHRQSHALPTSSVAEVGAGTRRRTESSPRDTWHISSRSFRPSRRRSRSSSIYCPKISTQSACGSAECGCSSPIAYSYLPWCTGACIEEFLISRLFFDVDGTRAPQEPAPWGVTPSTPTASQWQLETEPFETTPGLLRAALPHG
jgi:hypothetical protein